MIYFPNGVVDRDGNRIRVGATVELGGSWEGRRGEVVAFASRCLVVLLHHAEPEQDPEQVLVDPYLTAVVYESTDEPASVGSVVVDTSGDRVTLIVPVGTRDLVPRIRGASSPLPPMPMIADPSGTQRRPDIRAGWAAWADFCGPSESGDGSIYEHIAAPMVERVLRECLLPEEVHVVLVATDQIVPHPQDTVWGARMLERWMRVASGKGTLGRTVTGTEMVLLRRAPHIVGSVVVQMAPALAGNAGDCDRFVVLASGGTPAMGFGAVVASVRTGVPVTHVQVPEPVEGRMQAIVEYDVGSVPGLTLP